MIRPLPIRDCGSLVELLDKNIAELDRRADSPPMGMERDDAEVLSVQAWTLRDLRSLCEPAQLSSPSRPQA